MGVAAGFIPVALQVLAETPPLQSTAYLSTLYSLFWIAPYVLLGVGAIKEIIRDGRMEPVKISVISIGVFVFVALLVYNFASDPGGVFGALPYVMVGLTVAAFVAFSVVDVLNKNKI
ncbi:hypothetical protein D3C81_1894410 [compost metagenome]